MTPAIKASKTDSVVLSAAFAALLLFSQSVRAAAPDSSREEIKTKSINKSYSVRKDDNLQITNRFGDVTIFTWDKKEITVDINIEASASTAEKAQDILDHLLVTDDRNGNTIALQTKINLENYQDTIPGNRRGKNKTGKKNREQSSFHINYTVHMPANNALYVKNEFGAIVVPDFDGPIVLQSQFGSIHAGRLLNINRIDASFGKVFITAATNGQFNFNYNSEARISEAGGSLKINSEFSRDVQLALREDIRNFSLTGSYSDIRLVVPKTLSAQLSIHTSFSELRNDDNLPLQPDQNSDAGTYGPHMDKYYNGTLGNGKGKVEISSNYGSIRLSDHLTAAVMMDKSTKRKAKRPNKFI